MNEETTPLITIDAVGEVQLRSARITHAEKHPKANRLLRLEVELGNEQRQIVAGIAEAYTPEELVGRTVVIVANLKPAKLRGVESQGMLLAATGEDGTVRLVTVDGDLAPGAKIS